MSVAVEIGGNPGFFLSFESEVTRRLNGSNGGLVLWKFHPVENKGKVEPFICPAGLVFPICRRLVVSSLFFLSLSCARARSRSLPLLKLLCTSLLSSRGSCLSLRYSSVHVFCCRFFPVCECLLGNHPICAYFERLSVVDIRDFGALENRVVRALGQIFSYLGKYRSLNISVAASCEFE
jgi:hypothetical protein